MLLIYHSAEPQNHLQLPLEWGTGDIHHTTSLTLGGCWRPRLPDSSWVNAGLWCASWYGEFVCFLVVVGERAFRTLASFAGHTESFCAADLFKNPIISLDLLWNDYVRAMYYCILQWQKEGKEGKIYIYIFSMYLGQIPKKKSTEVLKAKSRSNCQYLGPKNEWNSV